MEKFKGFLAVFIMLNIITYSNTKAHFKTCGRPSKLLKEYKFNSVDETITDAAINFGYNVVKYFTYPGLLMAIKYNKECKGK